MFLLFPLDRFDCPAELLDRGRWLHILTIQHVLRRCLVSLLVGLVVVAGEMAILGEVLVLKGPSARKKITASAEEINLSSSVSTPADVETA